MIQMLSGNGDSAEIYKDSLGKTIREVKLEDDVLKFSFEDGTTMSVRDDGQSCCEHRYMSLDGDSDLSYFSGHKLREIEIANAPEVESEYGDIHEVQFMHVKTDKGTFSVSSHNEHNGYYGGFALTVSR